MMEATVCVCVSRSLQFVILPYTDSVQVDEATCKRLRHIINKRVLIAMVGIYLLQQLDKNAVAM